MKLLLIIGAILLSLNVCFAEESDTSTKELLDDFELAVAYFQQDRFSNAEILFSDIHTKLTDYKLTTTQLYYHTLYYLALSRSQLGIQQDLEALLQQRLELAIAKFGEESAEVANNLVNIAELRYRRGDTPLALKALDKAEQIFRALDPKKDRELEFVTKNRAEYDLTPFKASMLPQDMSEFYSACESLIVKEPLETQLSKMEPYVLVGEDYVPQGVWQDIFDMDEMYEKVDKIFDRRLIFLINQDKMLRDRWCTVYLRKGIVVKVDIND